MFLSERQHYRESRGRKRERIIFDPLVYSPNAHSVGAELDQIQQPGTSLGSPTWNTGTQGPEPSLLFSQTTGRELIRSGTVGTWSNTHMKFPHYKWKLNLLHHGTSPIPHFLYSIFTWYTSSFFRVLAIMNWISVDMGVQITLWYANFI